MAEGEGGSPAGRAFRGDRLTVGVPPATNDPSVGYASLGRSAADVVPVNPAVDGAGRPVAMAPSRLHPTRDFFPGQFYRPAVSAIPSHTAEA